MSGIISFVISFFGFLGRRINNASDEDTTNAQRRRRWRKRDMIVGVRRWKDDPTGGGLDQEGCRERMIAVCERSDETDQRQPRARRIVVVKLVLTGRKKIRLRGEYRCDADLR